MIFRNVQFIDDSAFCHLKLSSMKPEGGNDTSVFEKDLLIDVVCQFEKIDDTDTAIGTDIFCASWSGSWKSSLRPREPPRIVWKSSILLKIFSPLPTFVPGVPSPVS
jgi:hypothetical protein